MRYGIVTAVEGLLIGFLPAVVGKDLPRNLATGQPSPVGERGQIHHVSRPLFLQEVKHLVCAFVNEGHGAHLDADGLAFARGLCGAEWRKPGWRICCGQRGHPGAVLQEFTTVHDAIL
jgi:hypothetical protein